VKVVGLFPMNHSSAKNEIITGKAVHGFLERDFRENFYPPNESIQLASSILKHAKICSKN